MARLITLSDNEANRNVTGPGYEAERIVGRMLRQTLPDDVIIYHGLHWMTSASNEPHQADGESDFVILDPLRGILILEVKSGVVYRDKGKWYREREGRQPVRIKNPAQQVKGARHEILKRLQAVLPKQACPLVGYAVAFPDCSLKGPLPLDFHDAMMLTQEKWDLDVIGPAIERCYERIRHTVTAEFSTRPLTADEFQIVRRTLGEAIEGHDQLAASVMELDGRLIRFDPEQRAIADLLVHVDRFAVHGCPGSGKTLMLRHTAERLAESGKRVLVLTFNRKLAATLAAITPPRHQGSIVVSTAYRFLFSLMEGRPLETPTPTPDILQTQETSLQPDLFPKTPAPTTGAISENELRDNPETAQPVLDGMERAFWNSDICRAYQFHSILVDEAQDFAPHWFDVLEGYRNSDHLPTKPSVLTFYDSQQTIYHATLPPYLTECPSITLPRNRRNTPLIAQFAHQAAGIVPPIVDVNSGVGREPKVLWFGNPGDSLEALIAAEQKTLLEQLGQLLEHGFSSEHIVVLSLHQASKSVLQGRSTLGSFRFSGVDGTKDRLLIPPVTDGSIYFSTAQSFKGLEAPVVVVCDVGLHGDDSRAYDRKNLLVAMTRARSYLTVLARSGFPLLNSSSSASRHA